MKKLLIALFALSANLSAQTFDFSCVLLTPVSCFTVSIQGSGSVSEAVTSDGIKYTPTASTGWRFLKLTLFNGVTTNTFNSIEEIPTFAPCAFQSGNSFQLNAIFIEGVETIGGSWGPNISNTAWELQTNFYQERSLFDVTNGTFVSTETRLINVRIEDYDDITTEAYAGTAWDLNNDGDHIDEIIIKRRRVYVFGDGGAERVVSAGLIQQDWELGVTHYITKNITELPYYGGLIGDYDVPFNRNTESYVTTATRYNNTPGFRAGTVADGAGDVPYTVRNIDTANVSTEIHPRVYGVYTDSIRTLKLTYTTHTSSSRYASYVTGNRATSYGRATYAVAGWFEIIRNLEVQTETSWETMIGIHVNNDPDLVDRVERKYIIHEGNEYNVIATNDGWVITEDR